MNTDNRKIVLAFLFCIVLISAVCTLVPGCATVGPGNDPLVVRAEQAETSAKATFDMVLHTDDANRPFWQSNAPAFHTFCEWLRQPQVAGTNTLPRASAMIWQLNTVKRDYKGAKNTYSNALVTALVTLQSSLSQASYWASITTNTPAGVKLLVQ